MTKEDLYKVLDFTYSEKDDCFYDVRFDTLLKQKGENIWEYRLFDEVDGSSFFVKYVKSFDELNNLYYAINDKNLSFYKFYTSDGKGFVEEVEAKLHQQVLDGILTKCSCKKGKKYVMNENIKIDDRVLKTNKKSSLIVCNKCDKGYIKL